MSQEPRRLDPGASPAALFGAELRLRRARAGLSQSALGRLVHVSGDLIAKVEKAERRPLPDLVSRLDGVLDAGGDLGRLAVAIDEHKALAVPLTLAEELPGESAARALRDVLDGIRRLDHGLGSGHALSALRAHARLAEALLPGVRGSAEQEVLLTLAEVHQLSGWITFDHGDLASAEGSFVTARAYAELADCDALVAYVLGPSHGFAVSFNGDPREGTRRIDEALVRARCSGNRRLTAFVLAVGARAEARLGEPRACMALLDRAEDELARHDPDRPDPVWLEVFDEAALRGHRGSCWLDLGDAGRAIEPLVVQDTTAPRLFVRNRAIWLLDRARAHAALNQVDEACDAVGHALDVSAGTASRRTSGRLRDVAAILDRWESMPEVVQIRERIRVELPA